MPTHYDRYQENLLRRRLSNPGWNKFREHQEQMGNVWERSMNQFVSNLDRSNIPLAAKTDAQTQFMSTQAREMGNQFETFNQGVQEERKEITQQLGALAAANKDEQDAENNALITTAATAVGTLGGFIVGGLPGAIIGAGAGGVVGGVATQNWNAALESGVGMITDIGTQSKLNSVKDTSDKMGAIVNTVRGSNKSFAEQKNIIDSIIQDIDLGVSADDISGRINKLLGIGIEM